MTAKDKLDQDLHDHPIDGLSDSGDRPHKTVTRRDFLKGTGLLLAGGILAACASEQDEVGFQSTPWRTATPARVLESPMPPANGTPAAGPVPSELETFLAISSVLTGFEALDPLLGQVYLEYLQGNSEFSGQIPTLFEQSGVGSGSPPTDIESLTAAGIFDQEGTRNLADKIIEIWYTGTVMQGEEPVVVTFVDSLAWKAIHYTKPLTICGAYGFWAVRPSVND